MSEQNTEQKGKNNVKNIKYSSSKIFSHIDFLWENFLRARSLIPYLPENMKDLKDIDTAPYYQNKGYNARIVLDEPLKLKDIKNWNWAVNSINQGFIVRLYAYLEYCQVVGNEKLINQICAGWEELDLLRRLRTIFAHTKGEYNKNRRDHQKLLNILITKFDFNFDEVQFPKIFPIPIDSVLEPVVEGCKKYIIELEILEKSKL
jgi:hypothetical protein